MSDATIETIVTSAFPILTVAAIVFLGIIIIKCIMSFIKTALLQSTLDKLLVKFLLIVIKVCLGIFLALYAISVAGFPLSGFVAALSALTLAIGLAIQDIIAGVASGMMVVTTHPFKIGDYVEIGDKSGSIKEVSLFHTVLTTPDNKVVRISNKSVFSNDIINYSANPTRRLDMLFGLDYNCDRKLAFKVLKDMADNHPLVLKDPSPIVQIKEYGDSEIIYLLRVWVNNGDYWTVNFDFNRQILDEYEKNKLDMSYPRVMITYEDPELLVRSRKEHRND